jgi:hypothetical protein
MFIELPRRRLQFGLRSLLALITLAALGLWLAGEFNVVERRTQMRQFLAASAGAVESATKLRAANGEIYGPLGPGPPEPVFWRRWMGDEAVFDVMLPYGTSQSKLEQVKRVFPEARVHVCLYPPGYNQPAVGMF